MKKVDVAIEIKVKTICGPNLNLRPDLFIELSTFTPFRITLIQHITREIFSSTYLAQGPCSLPRDHSYHVTETVVGGRRHSKDPSWHLRRNQHYNEHKPAL